MMWAFSTSAKLWIKKKSHVIKVKDGNPSIKIIKTINKQKPKKINNQRKSSEDPMQRRLMVTK
jgi:hypothetical protein